MQNTLLIKASFYVLFLGQPVHLVTKARDNSLIIRGGSLEFAQMHPSEYEATKVARAIGGDVAVMID